MNEYTYIYILIYVCVRGCGERYKYIEVQSVCEIREVIIS